MPPPPPAIAKLRRPRSLALSIVSEGQSIVLVNMTFCCWTPLLKIICEITCNNNLTCCCCCRWMVECFVLFGIFLVIRSSLDPAFCGIFGWGYSTKFYTGRLPAPRSNSFTLVNTIFEREGISCTTVYHLMKHGTFHIPRLELSIPLTSVNSLSLKCE